METKIDGRKLTVEHFLNKRLKGEQYGEKIAYPMYVKMIYAQKTHLFRSKLMDGYYFEDDEKTDALIATNGQKEIAIIEYVVNNKMLKKFDKGVFYLFLEIRTHRIKNSFKLYLSDTLSSINLDSSYIEKFEKVREDINVFIELSKYIDSEVSDDLKIDTDDDILWFDWQMQIEQEYRKYLSDKYSVEKVDEIIQLITSETLHHPSRLK
jgi:hypothetical protein